MERYSPAKLLITFAFVFDRTRVSAVAGNPARILAIAHAGVCPEYGVVEEAAGRNRSNREVVVRTCEAEGSARSRGVEDRVGVADAFLGALEGASPRACACRVLGACAHTGLRPAAGA